MADLKPGKRYPLLLYTRLMAMYRWAALWLAALLALIGWLAPAGAIEILPPAAEGWAWAGAAVSAAYFLFTLYGRAMASVQCWPDHIRVQTGVFQLKISYARLRAIRPVDFSQLFPPSRQPWSQRRFLEPFFGQTGVGLTLAALPLDERLLRLFFNRYMFLPDRTGFLLLAKDWMELSKEIGSYHEAYLTRRAEARRRPGFNPNPFAK
ncbi:MAG: hypothetical protein HY784_01690 [Chloroflexi bacterium]|nr:hypothetical protein [Chloroflexota bacterium]